MGRRQPYPPHPRSLAHFAAAHQSLRSPWLLSHSSTVRLDCSLSPGNNLPHGNPQSVVRECELLRSYGSHLPGLRWVQGRRLLGRARQARPRSASQHFAGGARLRPAPRGRSRQLQPRGQRQELRGRWKDRGHRARLLRPSRQCMSLPSSSSLQFGFFVYPGFGWVRCKELAFRVSFVLIVGFWVGKVAGIGHVKCMLIVFCV